MKENKNKLRNIEEIFNYIKSDKFFEDTLEYNLKYRKMFLNLKLKNTTI